MTYYDERLNHWIKRITFKIKDNQWRPGRPLIPLMLSREEMWELMSILRHYRELRKEQNNGNTKKIDI